MNAQRREWLEADGLGDGAYHQGTVWPWLAGGCPFQAWSLGELVRLDRVVLAGAA